MTATNILAVNGYIFVSQNLTSELAWLTDHSVGHVRDPNEPCVVRFGNEGRALDLLACHRNVHHVRPHLRRHEGHAVHALAAFR